VKLPEALLSVQIYSRPDSKALRPKHFEGLKVPLPRFDDEHLMTGNGHIFRRARDRDRQGFASFVHADGAPVEILFYSCDNGFPLVLANVERIWPATEQCVSDLQAHRLDAYAGLHRRRNAWGEWI
jgi:hypothetical protein